MRRQQQEFNGIFPFAVPQGNSAEKVKNIKNEFGKFERGKDYLISDKNINEYTIISEKLKSCLRDIIWEKILGREEGHFFSSEYFSYQEGIDGLPDEFSLINNQEEILNIDSDESDSSKIFEINDKEEEKKWLENKDNKNDKKATDKDAKKTDDKSFLSHYDKKKSEDKAKFSTAQESSVVKKGNNDKGSGGKGAYWIIGILTFFSLLLGVVSATKR